MATYNETSLYGILSANNQEELLKMASKIINTPVKNATFDSAITPSVCDIYDFINAKIIGGEK